MDRALKWFLILPAALLRQAKRGSQNGRGRAEVAARFTAVSEDNWGALITALTADKGREEEGGAASCEAGEERSGHGQT